MNTSNKNIKQQSGAISKIALPFYELPPRKTSVDIINEARLAIRGKQLILYKQY